MASYTNLMYHLVWGTKFRRPVLIKPHRKRLYAYMAGFLREKGCHVYLINGVEDHLHLFTHIHQSIKVAQLVGELKRTTSIWIKKQDIFPEFTEWQVGYGAFTVGRQGKDFLMRYITKQEEHHQNETFENEFRRLLQEQGITYKEEYLWK